MRRAIKHFLRSPKVIVGELLALVLCCSLGAALPQVGTATQAEMAWFRDGGPSVTALVRLFALDHIFRSGWFLAATALAGASLALIVFEQVKRLRAQLSQRLTAAHFQNAPFRTEFERATLGGLASRQSSSPPNEQLRIWTERRIGLLGSPVFHLGLLLIIVAGALRALIGSEAVVDLVEGETLPPTPATPCSWF